LFSKKSYITFIKYFIDENEEYKKWGLDIYVKFRDTEDLQLLTGTRQSGGVSLKYIIVNNKLKRLYIYI